MLTIRPEQMKQFTAATDAAVDRDLIRYLRERFPKHLADKSDDELQETVRTSRQIGERYGIERADNLATLADFVVMYGPEFHKDEWANEVLRSPDLHGPDKVALLCHEAKLSGAKL